MREVFAREQMDEMVSGRSVLLKVSFVFPARDPTHTTFTNTNPALIGAVAQVLVENGARLVLIGDGETFATARYAFAMSGLKEALRILPRSIRKRVKPCYFDECAKDWIQPNAPIVTQEGYALDFPRVLRDVDIFISMPKLKVNIFAGITLSVKNGMGFIGKRTRLKYHNAQLHGMIADIFQLRPPDFVITDAILAGEGQGPMNATAYPTNLILFGNNGIAVDAVCCHLMGYEPGEIPHLEMLHERGYGPVDLAEIRLGNPKLLEERRHDFARPERNLDTVAPNIHVYRGETCESGCEAFVQAIFDSYGHSQRGWAGIGEAYIILGKGAQIPPEDLPKIRANQRRVFVYGNCAREHRKLGKFYNGCSPDYIRAMITMWFRNSFGLTPFGTKVQPWTLGITYARHILAKIGGKKYKHGVE